MKNAVNIRDIVVVAASLGGLQALRTVVAALPADLPASIFIVMHVGTWPSQLPQLLEASGPLPVAHACDGEPIAKGRVYVAPPDRHMLVGNDTIVLSAAPKENFTRPAADPLFRSAAVNYGNRAIGVVLTGKLDDGAAGLKAIHACGGYTIVQDPSTCAAPDMPRAALDAVPPDVVAPVEDIGAAIVNALTDSSSKGFDMDERERAALELKIATTGYSSPTDLEKLGRRTSMTCPGCGGVVWRIGEGYPLRYRCHTGHAFSAMSLEEQQRSGAEDALWSSVRRLEEKLLLVHEQLSLAETAHSPNAAVFRAEIAPLQIAIDAVRRLAIDSAASMPNESVG
ncbi:Protein-glutamate methylesterase [Burkholderia sp. 8Y]|uniref:chemotaxis protein CheB n=1 Tax=Burkholderia sp. 8Y TaxID=2653133 RepID=UPI0012F2B475|nr:chemotaxis protein CheB [Burkholderia sp. 8Y]VXC90097.1 Protein-glutamate methylesterase [Burkholderia sp. 8Y]